MANGNISNFKVITVHDDDLALLGARTSAGIGMTKHFVPPLIHKHLKMHRCVLSTVPTDALVLEHQVISIHSDDQICIASGQL